MSGVPEMIQQVTGQRDLDMRFCVCRTSAISVASSARCFVTCASHLCPSTVAFFDEEPDTGSLEEFHALIRSNQVAIDLHEAQPAGESHLPVEGIPGFPGFVFRSSSTVGFHDRPSLIMDCG